MQTGVFAVESRWWVCECSLQNPFNYFCMLKFEIFHNKIFEEKLRIFLKEKLYFFLFFF